jgi:hypothetical protein
MAATYDRSAEDLGNITHLEHLNCLIPDQRLATLFYVSGLGLTRDPYLMTSVDNMWVNCGRSQFHLITGKPQVLRGRTGLVVPDREALLKRLDRVSKPLEGTKFAYQAHNDYVDTVCPWGNEIRVHAPDESRFGRVHLGMPYLELHVPMGTADAIAKFYREMMNAPVEVTDEDGARVAHVQAGYKQELVYRETAKEQPAYDGHHLQIYVADFSGPHKKLKAKDLVFEESDQWQYRFKDIIDLDTGKHLFTVEHEVRSMTHPLHARPLVNRNPDQTNRTYRPGYETETWSQPYVS